MTATQTSFLRRQSFTVLPVLFALFLMQPVTAWAQEFWFKPIAPSRIYQGSTLYVALDIEYPSAPPQTWTLTGTFLDGQPIPTNGFCGPSPTPCVGPVWWDSTTVTLTAPITSAVAPGPHTFTFEAEAYGVRKQFSWPFTVLAPPAPLTPPANLSGGPIPGLNKWQNTLTSLAPKYCPPPPQALYFEDQIWYYDGARTYFQLADRTGSSAHTDCAFQIARQYRDLVLAANGDIQPWKNFTRGLRLAWERSGDPSFKNALVALANRVPSASIGGWIDDSSLRETSYVLNGYVEAERAGEPRHPEMKRAVENLLIHFDRLFVQENYSVHQTFTDGLGAEALINYYELTKDPRIPPTIKLMLDWTWNKAWNRNTFQILINPEPFGPKCSWGCQEYFTDLVNMTAPAYAWYWRTTGDFTYLQRGDEMFAHALDTDISYGAKIFNQNFRWSDDYVKWRTTADTASNCSVTASPGSVSFASGGGSATVTVTASGSQCGWTATTGASWVSTTPASGSGSGTVILNALANSGSARSTDVTVAGSTVTILQDAAPAPAPAPTPAPTPAPAPAPAPAPTAPAGSQKIAVFGTGFASGALVADSAVDGNYKLVTSGDPGSPGPSAFAVLSDRFPMGIWIGNSPSSKWIGPQADQTRGLNPGTYVYRTTFDLTGFDPSTAQLTGSLAADDSVVIRLNGAVYPVNANLASMSPFQITSGFVTGQNTLEFEVNNGGSWRSPTGLKVDLSGTAVPVSGGGGGTTSPTDSTLTISPNPVAVKPGETVQFRAKLGGVDTNAVTWRLSVPVGEISSTGLYTAPTSQDLIRTYSSTGITVGATSTTDSSKTAIASVTFQSSTAGNGFLLWNTGSGPSGVLPDGASDPNYQIVTTPNGNQAPQAPVVVASDRYPLGVWLENSNKSKWIAPVLDLRAGVPSGTYTYRLTFDLTGYDLSSVKISGLVAADDYVSLRLNGQTQFSNTGNFLWMTPFSLEDGFLPAVNTLEFVVTNAGTWSGPSGLRVELTGTGRRL